MINIKQNDTIKAALNANETIGNDNADSAQNAQGAEVHQDATVQTPLIPDEVYNNLPAFLKRGCELFTPGRERDVFLTGALVILSGCFNRVSGVYNRVRVFSNLFGLIVAGAGSGKGTLNFAKRLAKGIHDSISSSAASIDDSQNQRRRLFYIPANSSSAVLIRHLADNGGTGTVCETEADTLTQTLKQDWGGFSDILRCSFQHETVSYSRKANNEYIEIAEPKLSLVLSGTPAQAKLLIPSAENGLFSRFIFYTYSEPRKWKDVSPFGQPDLTEPLNSLSSELLSMANMANRRNINFEMSVTQWAALNRGFEQRLEMINEYENEDEAGASVLRLGLITFRIAMLLTALRSFSANSSIDTIRCNDADFNSAMSLSGVYLMHALHMMSSLPQSAPLEPNIARFYGALPEEFTKSAAIQLARSIGIKDRTTGKYLRLLVTGRQIEKVKHGHYKKA